MTRAARAALGLAALFAAGAARAAEYDSGDLKLDLTASLRELVAMTRELRTDEVFPAPNGTFSLGVSPSLLAQTRVRIDLQARYRERFSAQFSYDNEVFAGSGRRSLGFALDRKSTRLNSSHVTTSRMPSSA